MKEERGFTLIELLVYASVLAITVGLLMGILTNVLRISSREAGSTEVAQQLNFVINTVQSVINDSSHIDSVYQTDNEGTACDENTNYCTLELRFASDSLDPTWIIGRSTGVYIKRNDGGSEELLTDDRVITDRVKFTKYVFPGGGHDSVKIEIALTYNTDNPQFEVSRTIVSAFSRANAATFDDDLVPGGTTYDVGQSAAKWRDGWFSRDVRVDGAVGIGRAASTNKLEVEGDASKTSAGDWLANSDARIKKDVKDVENALDTVNRLRPVSFRYADAYRSDHPSVGNHVYYNFIAQEFRDVFPESVQESAEGLLQIDPHAANVFAVAAIQELSDKVDVQNRQLVQLAERYEALTGEEVNLEGVESEAEDLSLWVVALVAGITGAGVTLLLLKRKA